MKTKIKEKKQPQAEKDLKDKKKNIHPADRDSYEVLICDVDADEEQARKANEELAKELGFKK